MIVYFANRKMEIVGQASTSLPKGYTIIEDLKTEEIETGVSSFECKIEFDDKSRLAVEEMTDAGNYILRSNGDENEFYTIIETEIDTKEHYIYIYAEDAGLDLLNEIVGEYEATESQTAEWYINKYINDSGFEIGINEIPSTSVRKLKWDGEATSTERLASIANEFGGYEISYSYQISNMIITNKYVNIYKKRGKDVGIQLRLNRDIDRIITKKSVANLATAFRCTGGTPENSNTPITLKGYSYDDGDFYVGTDGVLRSRVACEKWSRYVWNKEPNQLSGYKGNIIRLYSYDTTSQATLCSHAITELKKICDMEVNYEVDIKKLPDNVKIGDRVNIVDDVGKLYLSTRILQLETSVTEQSQTATLGEYLIKNDGISQKVTELAEQFAQRAEAQKKVEDDLIIVKATVDSANTNASDALSKVESASSTAENANIIANEAKTIAEDTKALTNELIANSVTTEYLNANFAKINLANIDNGCITNAMIGTEAVNTSQIADGSITDAKIVTLTANKIDAGTLSCDRLVINGSEESLVYYLNNMGDLTYSEVDTINGGVLTERSITADKIVANAITANEIATATITANEIAANTITSAEIKSGSITADKINVSDLFAQDITATGTITGMTLKGGNISLSRGLYFCLDDDINNYIGGILYEVVSSSNDSVSGYVNKISIESDGYLSVGCGSKTQIFGEPIELRGGSLRIYSNSIAFNSVCSLDSALYLGTDTDSTINSTRFYINNNGTGRFKTLFENGTALSKLYAYKSHDHYGETFSLLNVELLNITRLGRINSNLITLVTGMYLGETTSYYINQNGTGKFANLYANGNQVTSSRRFKENIVYADENTWHDKIMNVKPCTFNYADETIDNKHIHIGVIAEDLYEVFPEVVSKNEDDLVSYVNYDELVIPLILEVQRLNKKIEELEQKVGGNSAS